MTSLFTVSKPPVLNPCWHLQTSTLPSLFRLPCFLSRILIRVTAKADEGADKQGIEKTATGKSNNNERGPPKHSLLSEYRQADGVGLCFKSRTFRLRFPPITMAMHFPFSFSHSFVLSICYLNKTTFLLAHYLPTSATKNSAHIVMAALPFADSEQHCLH